MCIRDRFIVIEAFELGFVDIEIFGNDAQNVYRFVIAAVGRIENCVLCLLYTSADSVVHECRCMAIYPDLHVSVEIHRIQHGHLPVQYLSLIHI